VPEFPALSNRILIVNGFYAGNQFVVEIGDPGGDAAALGAAGVFSGFLRQRFPPLFVIADIGHGRVVGLETQLWELRRRIREMLGEAENVRRQPEIDKLTGEPLRVRDRFLRGVLLVHDAGEFQPLAGGNNGATADFHGGDWNKLPV